MPHTLDRNTLYKKIGLVLRAVARDLYLLDPGEQIPTLRYYVDALGVSRRTVQDALCEMLEAGAIRLDRRGCKGSYLSYKDPKKLYVMSGWASITGMMPVPLTPGLKSLATAVYRELSKISELRFSFAFIQGSAQRAENLKYMPSTFMLCSLSSAKELVQRSADYELALSLPDCLYANRYVLAFRKGEAHALAPGQKMGLDQSSHDQSSLASSLAKTYQMNTQDIPYVGLLRALLDHEIDATPYRREVSLLEHEKLDFSELPPELQTEYDVTTPAIVVHKKDYGLKELLQAKMDLKQVTLQQKLILDKKAEAMFR